MANSNYQAAFGPSESQRTGSVISFCAKHMEVAYTAVANMDQLLQLMLGVYTISGHKIVTCGTRIVLNHCGQHP